MTATLGHRMRQAFGPIRIINLAERVDRRLEMTRELTQVDLSVPAGDFRFHTAQRPYTKGDFPTLAAPGCFESHMAVIGQIADGADDRGMLLEDDCNFTANLGAGIAAAETAQGGWEIFSDIPQVGRRLTPKSPDSAYQTFPKCPAAWRQVDLTVPVEQAFFAPSGLCGRANAHSWANRPVNPKHPGPAATFCSASGRRVLPFAFSFGLDRGHMHSGALVL
jgi:hypothetical protein